MDIFGSLAGLLLLSPVLLIVAFLVATIDGLPVIFKQERVGRNGVRFRIWKFRTMVSDGSPAGITVGQDSRITGLGELLRKSKIDELPQLLNVLLGEMSLVGPRPETPTYVAHYRPDEREVLAFVPGITDPASIKYRNEATVLGSSRDPEATYRELILPEKIRINLAYARRATLLSDFGIMLETVAVVLRDLIGGRSAADRSMGGEPRRVHDDGVGLTR